MVDHTDESWTSRDGLKLHYRDYALSTGACANDTARPVVLCLHGLTRNARDFANLARRMAGRWRVVCPDMRGRGDSAFSKDSERYNPAQYVEDLGELCEQAGIDRFVAIGTSMGGLLTMIMAQTTPGRVAGAVLNDVGPVLERAGLERIAGYIGSGRSYPTWMHAARGVEETQQASFPDYTITEWLAWAKRVMALSSNGRIVFDYDMKVAEPFARLDLDAQPDLWPGIDALAGKPVLLVRGALSDLLAATTMAKMVQRLPGAEAVTLDRIGHAPTLDEPEAVAAIERLLARVD